MKESFFADYKKFVILPADEKNEKKYEYNPQNYAAHYILTMSIFDSRISSWRDAAKYEINIEKSVHFVLDDFNKRQYPLYHLQLLELDRMKNYFILALSFKTKIHPNSEQKEISNIVNKLLTNPFYVGQGWYNLIGEKGRLERKLFCHSYKEYIVEPSKDMDEWNVIPKKIRNWRKNKHLNGDPAKDLFFDKKIVTFN